MELVHAGFGERILLSQDVCLASHLEAAGGSGYGYVLSSFLGRLEAAGMPAATTLSLVTQNPVRALTGA
jgi:phosphotriesterase-related protein